MAGHDIKQAVVLVGGKGTRLGNLVRDTPKPLMPIDGRRRFLDYLLENLARHGFEECILLAGHLGEVVQQTYAGARIRGMAVDVIREPQPAGTGGALSFAADKLHPQFLMSNGDSFLDFNYLALTTSLAEGAICSMALRRVDDTSRYGRVELENGCVTQFREKDPTLTSPGLISGGVYVMSRDVLCRISSLPCSIEADVFPQLANDRLLHGQVFHGYFLDIGLPESLAKGRAELPTLMRRPAVIFDRDGCLIEDEGYTHKPEDLRWRPGAVAAIRTVNDAGGLVLIATNQAGIAHGLYDEAAMHRFHARMHAELRKAGAHIDSIYFCPFHEKAKIDTYRIHNHPDRKPNPGMILRALAEWSIDPDQSLVIGDRDSDVEAARGAGLRGVLCGQGPLDEILQAHWRPALN